MVKEIGFEMSIRSEIKNNLATRLRTISAANGYSTSLIAVYEEKIPMGINLEPHEVPAILLISGPCVIDPKGQNCIYCDWSFYLQLIHADVSDSIMETYVREVSKAIFANSPSADRQDEYRLIHPSIYKADITEIEPDLNMIDANRFAIMTLKIKFITKYNLL
jgi:hypothetical protein